MPATISLTLVYSQSFKAQKPTTTAKLKKLIRYMRAKGCYPLLWLRLVFLSRSSATIVVARTRARQILRVPVTVRLTGAHPSITHPSRGIRWPDCPVFAILFLILKCDCTLPIWFNEFIRILQFGYAGVCFPSARIFSDLPAESNQWRHFHTEKNI